MKILIIAEHASTEFGGEAILPVHYFRYLTAKGYETWMVVHERSRQELEKRFNTERIIYIKDGKLHKTLWKVGSKLPARMNYWTFGFLLRILTQITARKIGKKLIRKEKIDIVHQPIPISPKEPSLLFGMGVPVVIGPMNGGMTFPPGFYGNVSLSKGIRLLRSITDLINFVIPGKYFASVLLVANDRTRRSLPKSRRGHIIELAENGVDLELWQEKRYFGGCKESQYTRFVFSGRLVELKATDILIDAMDRCRKLPVTLTIIGDGECRRDLERQAAELGLTEKVVFKGWIPQDQLGNCLGDYDVLLLPSLRECGGAVVLEAMAAGLPVIATRWGGPVDYLDESCGFLIEPKSRSYLVSGFAEAMTVLSGNRELRETMAVRCRKMVEKKYDWEKRIDTILKVYNSAIQNHVHG